MKIKPLYIYGSIAVIAILVLIVLTQSNSSDSSSTNISNKQMPQDSIHSGLGNPTAENPTKDNVTENVKHKLEMLKKAVDDNPNDTLKIREYADFLAAAHKQLDAIQYYERILQINPKRTDIYFSLSFIYYNNQNFTKAEELTNKILSYDKKNVQALYNLGAISASIGNKEKAKKIWENLLSEFPNSEVSDLTKTSLSQLK
ncbi:MAG TPA: tetratricopeptide repeat protein [Ignavibacteriaceae bacterium]|nr:tetratricopeptide repeat protein [Ignavibacteriaceae bacterium]